jgi:replicative superfamily II helicase
MSKYGILRFSKREIIGKNGIIFTEFPDRSSHVVSTKTKSNVDRWAKVNDKYELLEILGPVGDYAVESEVLHRNYGIKPTKYPSYVFNKTNGIPEVIHEVFSVDNPGTKDIDDALSIEVNGNKITLGIHISDVAFTMFNGIKDPTELLEFVKSKASSTYTDIENTTMFPPRLTFEELSLNQNKIRRTITLWSEFLDGELVGNRFESCYVKNISAIDYSQFREKFPIEYKTLSKLSSQTEPAEIIAWTMLTYNKIFAKSFENILLRSKEEDGFAQYSLSDLKKIHYDIGTIYCHSTSPIRRYSDLYNQIAFHKYELPGIDINSLNEMTTNVKLFQHQHAILDLSHSCRSVPIEVEIVESTSQDFVRVKCKDKSYTIPRFDSYYNGDIIEIGACFMWGIVKNGFSTLRIQTELTEFSDFETKDVSQSAFEVLDDHNFTKEDVEEVLGHPLDQFQTEAFEIIKNGEDLFAAAPTGSGKTAVAMTAILKAFKNGKRAIFTSPIKALSNEKYCDFRTKLDGRVSLLTGDVKVRCTHPGGDGQSELIIMTSEILRNKLLYDKIDDDLIDVEVVVIDEAHYINDSERGGCFEEIFMGLPKNIQLVCLSATMDKPQEFCNWLSQRRPCKLVQRFDRHVPLYFGSIVSNDRLHLMDDISDSKQYTWNQSTINQSVSKLCNSLVLFDLCPAIVFCMSKKKCVKFAQAITDNLVLGKMPIKPKPGSSEEEISIYDIEMQEHSEKVVNYKKKFEALKNKYLGKYRKQLQNIPGYNDWIELLQRGVAYHHSGKIPLLREFVEVLFRNKLIMVVFATETLACGIDMPARSVVFTEVEKPCGNDQRRTLKTEEFMQMAGRAGRRGRDVKGFVLYYSLKNQKVPYSTFHHLALGKPPKATSQLDVNPEMVLRNLKKGYVAMHSSLLFSELKCEENVALKSYNELSDKIEDKNLDRIFELDSNLRGDGFIKLTPKQTKKAKNELRDLLNGKTIEDARSQMRLRNQLHESSYIDTMWNNGISFLQSHEFIDDEGKMYRKGVISSQMCDGMPLVRGEILDKIINDSSMDCKILVSWLSLFAEGVNFQEINLNVPDELKHMIEESKYLAEKYYDVDLNQNVCYLVYDWLIYKDLRRILSCIPLSDLGMFVKVILRTASFIEETMKILLGLEIFEIYNNFENYQELLFSGLVSNSSIYV